MKIPGLIKKTKEIANIQWRLNAVLVVRQVLTEISLTLIDQECLIQ